MYFEDNFNPTEPNDYNNQGNTNKKMNHNEFYIGNSNNIQLKNIVNNNFPSSSQKNKLFVGRVLSNKNKLSNKIYYEIIIIFCYNFESIKYALAF